MDDYHLPPESILKAKIKKKNKSLGWETRYIVFGLSQVLFARDQYFKKLLNVIPLTAGTFVLKCKAEQLIIRTSEREFTLKFATEREAATWFVTMTKVSCRDHSEFVKPKVEDKHAEVLDKNMKKYLQIEDRIKQTLEQLNELTAQKDQAEKKLIGLPEYEDYVNSDKKLEKYHDSLIKHSVKSITQLYEEIANLKQRGITPSSVLLQNKLEMKMSQNKGMSSEATTNGKGSACL